MQLTVALLATLLSTTLASYSIQHAATKNYLFIDVLNDGATSANVFVAPLEEIQMRKSHHMNFDLTSVGDTFMITEVETGMALYDTSAGYHLLGSQELIAQKMDAPDDRAKWYLKPFNSKPGFVLNKFTSRFLYAYRVDKLGLPISSAFTKRSTGRDLVGGSTWNLIENPSGFSVGEEWNLE